MINTLSILIPCHNCDCSHLVRALSRQCNLIDGLKYEIIIVDDGSDCRDTIDANNALADIEFVSCIMCEKSNNRSAMRNRLATFAKYDWQLQINSNVHIPTSDFVRTFMESADDVMIVCGNTTSNLDKSNLRSVYEYTFNKRNDIAYNNAHPYSYFRNTCCLYNHRVFAETFYDESVSGYGYEDILFGQRLRMHGFPIRYIDNPVEYNVNVSNSEYVRNTEESLHTLHYLQETLISASRLLKVIEKLRLYHLLWALKMFHAVFGKSERANLCGRHPSVFLFSLYKLGYYISIK